MMEKTLSPAAIVALKEALCSIYWYKPDLKSFLSSCGATQPMLNSLDWDNYKRQIVSDFIDQLITNKDLGLLTKLCYEACNFASFDHLKHIDDGEKKIQKAREAVENLNRMVKPHQDAIDEEKAIVSRQQQQASKLASSSAVREKLKSLNSNFMEIATSSNPQKKGFDLEKLMYDIFELFDLDPKASFRNLGEQLDGAFSLDGTDYLFEAKWQKDPISVQDLDGFAAKVRRKLDNTLGVFLSMEGFSSDGVTAHAAGRPSVVLMDGTDLMAVLDERIDFVSLLQRKKQHAARTGNIYLRVHEIGI